MPAPSVSNFLANFKGGARPNRYEVNLTFPILGGTSGITDPVAAAKALSFTCSSSKIPGSTVSPCEVPYMGRTIKLAGDRTFEDWTLTVINDTDFLVRRALEQWLSAINAHDANVTMPGFDVPSRYQTSGIVTQLGRIGGRPSSENNYEKLRSYRVQGIFPTDLAEIDLDWSQNNTVENFTVTFAVNWWEVITEVPTLQGQTTPTIFDSFPY